MSDIKIPSWTLPIAAGIIPAAIAWGTMQAQAEATAEDISRVSVSYTHLTLPTKA